MVWRGCEMTSNANLPASRQTFFFQFSVKLLLIFFLLMEGTRKRCKKKLLWVVNKGWSRHHLHHLYHFSAYPQCLPHQTVLKGLQPAWHQSELQQWKIWINYYYRRCQHLVCPSMCARAHQRLRCKVGASRGKCSWPVWQTADTERTLPPPAGQHTNTVKKKKN